MQPGGPQGSSMSGIVNHLLDEARAGKRGLHVLAQYDTEEEALKSDNIRPTVNLMKGGEVVARFPKESMPHEASHNFQGPIYRDKKKRRI